MQLFLASITHSFPVFCDSDWKSVRLKDCIDDQLSNCQVKFAEVSTEILENH